MIVKNDAQLTTLRECGRKLAHILHEVASIVRPGIATVELDRLAEDRIRQAGGDPVFKGYKTKLNPRPYPGSLCVSINDEVVHGIPSANRILAPGDIVGLDIGMRWPRRGGLITDTALTIGVDVISPEAEKLLRVTKESLHLAVSLLKPGIHLGNLGSVIQSHLEEGGYGVVRELAGHGVGEKLHEEPYVMNYGKKGEGARLVEHQVIAIEPMATVGSYVLKLDQDGWTFKTRDGGLAAHFEHTVVILKDGAEILTK